MKDRQLHTDRAGDRLVATAGDQDVGDQAQDVAGHRAVRGGMAGGVVKEAAHRAHRRAGVQQGPRGPRTGPSRGPGPGRPSRPGRGPRPGRRRSTRTVRRTPRCRGRPARALRSGRAQPNGPPSAGWTVSTSSRSRPMPSRSGRRAAHSRRLRPGPHAVVPHGCGRAVMSRPSSVWPGDAVPRPPRRPGGPATRAGTGPTRGCRHRRLDSRNDTCNEIRNGTCNGHDIAAGTSLVAAGGGPADIQSVDARRGVPRGVPAAGDVRSPLPGPTERPRLRSRVSFARCAGPPSSSAPDTQPATGCGAVQAPPAAGSTGRAYGLHRGRAM